MITKTTVLAWTRRRRVPGRQVDKVLQDVAGPQVDKVLRDSAVPQPAKVLVVDKVPHTVAALHWPEASSLVDGPQIIEAPSLVDAQQVFASLHSDSSFHELDVLEFQDRSPCLLMMHDLQVETVHPLFQLLWQRAREQCSSSVTLQSLAPGILNASSPAQMGSSVPRQVVGPEQRDAAGPSRSSSSWARTVREPAREGAADRPGGGDSVSPLGVKPIRTMGGLPDVCVAAAVLSTSGVRRQVPKQRVGGRGPGGIEGGEEPRAVPDLHAQGHEGVHCAGRGGDHDRREGHYIDDETRHAERRAASSCGTGPVSQASGQDAAGLLKRGGGNADPRS